MVSNGKWYTVYGPEIPLSKKPTSTLMRNTITKNKAFYHKISSKHKNIYIMQKA